MSRLDLAGRRFSVGSLRFLAGLADTRSERRWCRGGAHRGGGEKQVGGGPINEFRLGQHLILGGKR